MSMRYAKFLIFWGVVFVISLFFIFTGFGNNFSGFPESSIGLDKPPVNPEGEEGQEEEPNWNIILGVVTAVISGAGFMATTIFALREDRRDTALYDLQIKNLQKEIEQKNLEIEKLRREQEPYDST